MGVIMLGPDIDQAQSAFAQLAAISLSDHSVASVMDRIAGLTKSTIPGADEVSITLVEQGKGTSIACTGPLAIQLDERQYAHGYGPCLAAVEGGETILIDDMAAEHRWRDWTAEATRHGALSSLSIPVPLLREVMAAINIYSTARNAFDTSSVETATTFGAHAGVALANMQLYDSKERVAQQLQAAMTSRATIEQAKGILMGQRRCSADDAFGILVELSQDTNRKLRDVAQVVIDETLRGPGSK